MSLAMDRPRAINLPPAVIWLSLAFIAVHLVRQVLSPATDEWVLIAFGFTPVRYLGGGAVLPGGEAARFWSPITYAFLHANFLHLFVNIIWMASFGSALARRFGSVRFLVLSAISAVAGAALHYVLHRTDQALVIGASGGISGMMAGTARFAFARGGPLAGGGEASAYRVPGESLLGIARNGRAVAFIAIWFVVNIVFGIAGGQIMGAPGAIAWEDHIGGFLAGLLLFPLFDPVGRRPDERLASWEPPP
jgi:membrane associated rhomboid family serine protease